MPALAPRVLVNSTATVTYDVSTFDGKKAVFVNSGSQALFANQSTLTEATRPTAQSNDGHKLTVALALPHPVVDQEGCCVDKNAPATSYLNLNTLLSKFATAEQANDFVALIRSYVGTTAFAELVKGKSNY